MKDKQRFSIFLYIFLCAFFLAVQSVNLISIYTFSPDFILILTIIFAFLTGSFKGQFIAFILGLLLDVMSGGIFGLNAFVMVLVAACAGLFLRAVKIPSILTFILYIILMTIVKYLLFFFFYVILEKINLANFAYFVKIPGELILNLIFGILIYLLFAKIDNREHYEWF